MEGHSEALLDKLGDAPRRPQFGGKAESLRAVAKPAEHLLSLFGGQVRGTTGARLGGQRRLASVAISLHPASHRPVADTEELGNFYLRITGVDALHRQAPALLEFLARP